jgi:hypothetical protein
LPYIADPLMQFTQERLALKFLPSLVEHDSLLAGARCAPNTLHQR